NPLTAAVEVLPGTPVGFYTVSYQIEDKANPGIVALADAIVEVTDDVSTVLALKDTGNIDGFVGGTAINNVLVNDTFNSLPATLSDVTIIQESTSDSRVILDTTTGEVKVSANTPTGV